MSNEARSFKCLRCTKDFDTVMPKMEVIAGDTATMMLWAHPKPVVCPHCGQNFQMAVAKIDGLALMLQPINSNNEARIITPPAGLQFK